MTRAVRLQVEFTDNAGHPIGFDAVLTPDGALNLITGALNGKDAVFVGPDGRRHTVPGGTVTRIILTPTF